MRRLCQRALSNITDNPKAITTLWLEYESMNGSLDSFLNCETICEERWVYIKVCMRENVLFVILNYVCRLKKFALEKKTNEKQDEKKQKKTPKAKKIKVRLFFP